MADATRAERVGEFLRRLAAAPAAADHDEAFAQVAAILIAVEDEMTSIPFDPSFPLMDGRLYPPRPDNRWPVPGRPDLSRHRTRGHNMLIRDNGAIRIVDLRTGAVAIDKPGADGRTIEQEAEPTGGTP